MPDEDTRKWKLCLSMAHLLVLVPIFGLATCWLYLLTRFAPSLDTADEVELSFPTSLEDLRELAKLLNTYYTTHPKYIVFLFANAYIYKQAFTIPGSALLNLLGGALFGVVVGFPLCCVLTGIGASCCFVLSKYIGKETFMKWFPNQLEYLRIKVNENEDRLFYYLLFLRMFPMSPNWLINILAPLVGIPYWLFLSTVFIGLMPYNYVCVQAGEMLATLTSMNSIYTPTTLLKLTLLAVIALGPSFLFKRNAQHQHLE